MRPANGQTAFPGIVAGTENVCASCGRVVVALHPPVQCPRCLKIGVFSLVADDGRVKETWAPQALSKVKRMKVERVKLRQEALDWMFNGGMVKKCLYYFTGPPGAGKSRWALQACQFFERPLYLAAEESSEILKLRQHEMGLGLACLDVQETQDMELVARHITTEYDGVILDSAHRMSTRDVNGAIGTPLMVESVIRLASDIARKLGQVWVVIGHVNADGEQSGKVANVHDVDAHVTIRRPSERGADRELGFAGKHRHGPAERRVRCVMTAQGLDNFERMAEDSGDGTEAKIQLDEGEEAPREKAPRKRVQKAPAAR